MRGRVSGSSQEEAEEGGDREGDALDTASRKLLESLTSLAVYSVAVSSASGPRIRYKDEARLRQDGEAAQPEVELDED